MLAVAVKAIWLVKPSPNSTLTHNTNMTHNTHTLPVGVCMYAVFSMVQAKKKVALEKKTFIVFHTVHAFGS